MQFEAVLLLLDLLRLKYCLYFEIYNSLPFSLFRKFRLFALTHYGVSIILSFSRADDEREGAW